MTRAARGEHEAGRVAVQGVQGVQKSISLSSALGRAAFLWCWRSTQPKKIAESYELVHCTL